MIIFLASFSFALSMLDVTSGVLGRSPFQISGTQDILEQKFDGYFDSRDISDAELNLRMYQLQYTAVQNSMNSGNWSSAADMWRVFLQKSTVNNAFFLESEKSLFIQMQQIQTSQDLEFLLHNYSLQTWYIICLTRANKHFEAQYQLNKWAKSLGLYSSEEKEHGFLNRKQEKDIQSWIDIQMQVNIERQLIGSDTKSIDIQLNKEEQEAVIWLLSEYRILRSWVEGEQGKDRSSLQHARQASKILEGYAVFQREQDRLRSDKKNVLHQIPTVEKSSDHSVHSEQQNFKIERDFLSDDRILFYEGSLFAVDILEMRSWMSLKRHKRADGVLERRKNMSLKDLDDAWLWYEVGVESLWKGDQEEGLIYLERAINSKYSSPLHVQVLFMQLIEKQNFALALRFVIDGIQRFPNSNLLSILLREMDNPGLQDYWKQSSLQPERKWVRAIWGVYVSESLIEKVRDGETQASEKEEITEKKREHVFDLLRTSFLFLETSDVVIEKYFALCKQMKRQNDFIKDMIALHKKGYIFQHEHQRILLEVLSSYTPDQLTGLGEEIHLDFMKLQLFFYQDIFNKRHKNTTESNLTIHEHRIGGEIAKNFVYFYRNDSLSVSLFWTRELLYWKGWHLGDLLKIWCPYFEKEGNKRELLLSKISGSEKSHCSRNMRQPDENTLRDIEIQDLNWFLYYAYLWHDILNSEQQYWTIDKGELIPLSNEDFLSVRESKSKHITNRNFKKNIQTGLVTEKDSRDDSRRSISLSKEEIFWFLEHYYINLLIAVDRKHLDEYKNIVLLLYNWLQIYEEHQDKYLLLKESLLQSIEHENICVSEQTLTRIIDSETKVKMHISDCLLQPEWKTQDGFSEKQREHLLEVFSLQNVQSMEETLFGE